MRTISLHDSRSGQVVELRPRDPGKVGIYACGPTVYSRIHVGNARPFVVFSLLKRFLEHEGLEAVLVANVTDINDKIYTAARAAGVGSEELARDMTAHYVADTERLGLGRPDHEPLASEYVEPIVALIGDLVDGGHAYAAGGDVYFRVRSLPSYGELSHRTSTRWTRARASRAPTARRIRSISRSGRARRRTRTPSWESPWGRGRPGWHIECSAMAEQLLGRRASTSTAAAPTCSSRTTRTRRRRRWPRAGSRSRACGCTTGCSSSPTRRCRSPRATSAG